MSIRDKGHEQVSPGGLRVETIIDYSLHMTSAITIDNVRDYWDARPCNLRHSSSEIGTKDYFDEVEERRYFVEPHIRQFADFSRWEGKTVLEIGCGIGTDAINFIRAGATFTGTELSAGSLEICRSRVDLFGFSETELIQVNVEELTSVLGGRNFDLIYSFGVLHHTPDINRALAEIRKLSNSGTVIKVMLYAKNSWKNAMIEAGLDQPEAQVGCPIANTYSKQEVYEIFGEAGLKVTSIKQWHIFPYVIEKYINYEYEIQPWFSSMPKNMYDGLQRSLGWHLLIEAEVASKGK
jgi:ubiquinone/menaquinone biosynthesis C-methylase UbiE